MPFYPGEEVNLRFVGNPETAALTFLGQAYTVANGGLEVKLQGALVAVLRLPRVVGTYPYEFTDGTSTETGHLRVKGDPPRQMTPSDRQSGPRGDKPASATLDQLRELYAAGHIEVDEFEWRVQKVLSAAEPESAPAPTGVKARRYRGA